MLYRKDLLVDSLVRLEIRDDENYEWLKNQIVCFLIHLAAERHANYILDLAIDEFNESRSNVDTNVDNKLLVCSILLDDKDNFFDRATISSEPSVELFRLLKRALSLTGFNMHRFKEGFRCLLDLLRLNKRLPDALWVLEAPRDVAQNPNGFVAILIDDYFSNIEAAVGYPEGDLGFEEAGTVIRICVEYHHGFDRATQSVLP